MAYRCEAGSIEGFVQQVAVCYIRHGYYWYVSGYIKGGKDPAAVDRKLIEKYGIDISERERTRRKKAGIANLQYIRYGRFFLIMATAGHHKFKRLEGLRMRDCRRHPVRFEGYSISRRRSGMTPKGGGPAKWHSHVQIDAPTYKQLKTFFLDRAVHRSLENLSADFGRAPFARYAPVRRQLLNILRAVNDKRARMGYKPLPYSALRLRRRIVKPFQPEERSVASAA